MKKSKFFSLKIQDFAKGLITAFLAAFVMAMQQSLDAEHLPVSWPEIKPILMAGIGGGIAYLTKNLLTNSNDQFLKKEQTPV